MVRLKYFQPQKKMTYAWGEDGSLAMTNHKGHVAVFSLTGSENEPYEILYSGKVQRGLDNALFDTEMVSKKEFSC